ncbi:helix-turn-helix transcriptional regulator [Lentisalinibacter orientalis]|uniref:helix-turn-helix transcriptional regulator n=1 Tax=Lentisalinibacter orientalis TaxID=2992241 RepID=UPI00386DDAF8
MAHRFLRLPDVMQRTGLSRSSIYAKIAEQDFPSPVRLGAHGRSVAWVEAEVIGWIEQQIVRERRGPIAGS